MLTTLLLATNSKLPLNNLQSALQTTGHTTIKITSELRNVGDAARDAYAMSHLSAAACTQRLAAGRGDGYQVTGISLQHQQLLNGRALNGLAVRRAGLVMVALCNRADHYIFVL